MVIIDLFKQIFYSLWTHKVRTSLALFGIVWGTVTVIILLALGNGFYDASMKDLAFLNNGTIFGWTGTTSKPYAGLPPGQTIHLREKDVMDMVSDIPGIKSFSPVFNNEGILQYQTKKVHSSILGVGASYAETQQFKHAPKTGFFNSHDVTDRNRVVYLNSELKQALFKNQEALGKILYIKGIPFTIVGAVADDKEGLMRFSWGEKSAFIPYTTFSSIFGPQDVRMLFITPDSVNATNRIKRNLQNMLAMKFHYDPTDEEAFHLPDLEKTQVFFIWFFRIVEIFLGFCGLLTLSVGGLGTANMMFLIVTERTREIGLRMALGAEQSHILLQFVLETLLLVSLGGFIGAILSVSILTILRQYGLPDWMGVPHISFGTTLATIFILALVGLAAGYFPARRAANMEPVRALAF